MWKRGCQQIRAAIPGAVFEGPSVATGPRGAWASAFLDYVKTNNVVPNYVSWHDEGGGNDPLMDSNAMSSALSSRGLSVTGFDVNEYATSSEQNPGHSSWLQSAGATKVVVERMPTGTASVSAPALVSSAATTVTCNSLTVRIDWTTATDGYVITLTPA